MVCNCECDNCTDKASQIKKAWSWEGVRERWEEIK